MNETTTNDEYWDEETDESDDDRPITTALSEAECIAVQHALLTVANWNYEEGDEYLETWHNDIRKRFIDSHEEYLKEENEWL